MEDMQNAAGAQVPASSTVEVDGLTFNVIDEARRSWDAAFLSRDIAKLEKRYKTLPDGAEKSEVVGDLLATMLEYVCFTSDLTREKISAHLGKYASVPEVSQFIVNCTKVINAKNF